MGLRIQSNAQDVQQMKQALRSGLDELCAIRLETMHGFIPTVGSSVHDGNLRAALDSAIKGYRTMIEQDIEMVQGIHEALAAADDRAAHAMS